MADISQIKLPNGDTYNLVDDTSGYLAEETDPVFSASAASGISTEDIGNWNSKVGINQLSVGYIDGDTIYISSKMQYGSSDATEDIGLFYFVVPSRYASSRDSTARTTVNYVQIGTHKVNIASMTFTKPGLYRGYVSDGTLDQVQRIATLSDIPTIPTNISSFTNDSGYLTLSTLPIYDGTVE